MKPERQEYEEQFQKRNLERLGLGEVALRREVLLGLSEEEMRLRKGATEEEIEGEERLERATVRRARNARAISEGSLRELIQEEELEERTRRIREVERGRLGLRRALVHSPVFWLVSSKRAIEEAALKAKFFGAVREKEARREVIREAIRVAGFDHGEIAVDAKKGIALLSREKGRVLIDALRAA